MKKLILSLMMVIGFSIQAQADTQILEALSEVPALKQGIAFSFADSAPNYLSVVEVKRWGKVSLNAGYAGRVKETGDKAVGMLSYDIISLKDKTTVPGLNWVELSVGAWAGLGRIGGSNEMDYGVGATVINLKW